VQVNYYNQAYDYGSVMHYDAYGFAVDPSLPTIRTTDAAYQSTIGQRITPSFVDFAQVRLCEHHRIDCADQRRLLHGHVHIAGECTAHVPTRRLRRPQCVFTM
jgi:hypothetical protein